MKRNQIKLPDCVNCSITKEFTQIPNALLRNPEISAKAKTLLAILLSNKEGWKTYRTSLQKVMKEGLSAIDGGLRELENFGYLARIRYRKKTTKEWVGSIWAYADIPYHFNLEELKPLLEERGWEMYLPKKPGMENPNVGKASMENQSLKRLYIKKTNNKDIIGSDEPDGDNKEKKLSIKERNELYSPITKKLSSIVCQIKNMQHTPEQLREWNNDVRLLVEGNKISPERIIQALDWYETNVGREYIPVIESGYSLRQKFSNLEDAIKRGSHFGKGKDAPKSTGKTGSRSFTDTIPGKYAAALIKVNNCEQEDDPIPF